MAKQTLKQREATEIIIPELEEIMKTRPPCSSGTPWTDLEIARLSRYYGKVPFRELMKYFPNRTILAVRQQVKALMLGKPRD